MIYIVARYFIYCSNRLYTINNIKLNNFPGTVLGIAGSTINNHLKMAEFRDMMEQQMARSASVLYTIAGGGTASRADITEAMKTEFAYQVPSTNILFSEMVHGLCLKTPY